MVFNLIVISIFLFLLVWISKKHLETRKNIIYKCRLLSSSKTMFIFIFFILVFSLFSLKTYLDLIRVILMLLVLIIYALIRDGFSEEGLYLSGNLITYDKIKSYDFLSEKNKFIVYISRGDNQNNNIKLIFDLSFKNKLEIFLGKKLIKRHKRIK